jgi:tRNA/rRNA methyltransferase
MIKTIFILDKTAVAENIGAAARAIKTMGFDQLFLINPKVKHLDKKAKILAHGSIDILEKAIVFDSLDAAKEQLDFLIGTTANIDRTAKNDFHHIRKTKQIISSKKNSIHHLGILFGSEESGLSNLDLKKCDVITSIPIQQAYPSLNLAQTVMIVAYELSDIPKMNTLPKNEIPSLYPQLKNEIIELWENNNLDTSTVLFNRILERLALTNTTDAKLFLSALHKIKKS